MEGRITIFVLVVLDYLQENAAILLAAKEGKLEVCSASPILPTSPPRIEAIRTSGTRLLASTCVCASIALSDPQADCQVPRLERRERGRAGQGRVRCSYHTPDLYSYFAWHSRSIFSFFFFRTLSLAENLRC
jgi:hypothetical protein